MMVKGCVLGAGEKAGGLQLFASSLLPGGKRSHLLGEGFALDAAGGDAGVQGGMSLQ